MAQDAALLNQANEAFDAVVRALLLVADNCSDFSRLSAVALELHSYHLEQLEDPAETSRIRIQAVGKQEPWLEVKGLTLCLADRTLVGGGQKGCSLETLPGCWTLTKKPKKVRGADFEEVLLLLYRLVPKGIEQDPPRSLAP